MTQPRRIGRCIYCGADGANTELKREHIIPYSLGGQHTLLEASCGACEVITTAVEEYCCRRMFGDARVHMNMSSRRKKNSKRTHLPIEVDTEAGMQMRQVPVDDHPGMLCTFTYDLPGILLGIPPSDQIAGRPTVKPLTANFRERVIKQGGKGVRIPMNHDAEKFAQMLAKIGYCYAVSVLGLDGFSPLVIDLITGKPPLYASHYVGSEMGEVRPNNQPHTLGLLEHAYGGQRFVTARVWLFSNQGMPPHYVVVGR